MSPIYEDNPFHHSPTFSRHYYAEDLPGIGITTGPEVRQPKAILHGFAGKEARDCRATAEASRRFPGCNGGNQPRSRRRSALSAARDGPRESKAQFACNPVGADLS